MSAHAVGVIEKFTTQGWPANRGRETWRDGLNESAQQQPCRTGCALCGWSVYSTVSDGHAQWLLHRCAA